MLCNASSKQQNSELIQEWPGQTLGRKSSGCVSSLEAIIPPRSVQVTGKMLHIQDVLKRSI